MTNKQRIEKEHLNVIYDVEADISMWGEYGGMNEDSQKEAANNCTKITAEEIGKAMEWVEIESEYFYENGFWSKINGDGAIPTSELVQLYLNQQTQ